MLLFDKKKAFSLVELSIVLVILGLMVGGVLAGQSLIRAAQLRSAIVEYERYQTSIRSFRDKYQALPGDMPNATAFWGLLGGTATANDATCNALAATDSKTCNGNGDSKVAPGTTNEHMRFWQHLVNAGLIEGKYTGANGATAPTQFIIGTNVPGSKLCSNCFWQPQYEGTHSGEAHRFDSAAEYGNTFFFSTWQGAWKGAVRPAEMWNLDKKIDDGIPHGGTMLAPWGANYSTSGEACTTAVNSADFTATYNFSSNGINCYISFVRAF